MRSAAAEDTCERRLEIVLFSGDVVVFRNYEFVQATWHRYLLIHYALGALLLTLLDIRSGDYDVSLAAYMQVVFTSLVVFLLVLIMVPALGMALLGKDGGVLRIRASWLLFCSTVLGIIAGQIALWLITGNTPRDIATLLAMVLFYYLLGEIIYHYILLVIIPRVLRDLRGEWDDAPGSLDGAEAEAEDGSILIRGERVDPAMLWHVMADGNYIHVRTAERRAFLPGPFGPVVARLPDHLGMRVSRSDWVARRAVCGMRREGRALWLELVDGSSVKVAHARLRAVQDWLPDVVVQHQPSGRRMSIQTGS